MKRITRDQWIWMPHPAHFVFGHECQFHLSTKVGKYIISTIGDWLPDYPRREIEAKIRGIALVGEGDDRLANYMKKIGYKDLRFGYKFETMVFPAKKHKEDTCCQWRAVILKDVEDNVYKTSEEAFKGHYKMCDKYSKK
jgi:hypothetical protein